MQHFAYKYRYAVNSFAALPGRDTGRFQAAQARPKTREAPGRKVCWLKCMKVMNRRAHRRKAQRFDGTTSSVSNGA